MNREEFEREYMGVWEIDRTIDPLIDHFKKLYNSTDAQYRIIKRDAKHSGFIDSWTKDQIKTAKSIASNSRPL